MHENFEQTFGVISVTLALPLEGLPQPKKALVQPSEYSLSNDIDLPIWVVQYLRLVRQVWSVAVNCCLLGKRIWLSPFNPQVDEKLDEDGHQWLHIAILCLVDEGVKVGLVWECLQKILQVAIIHCRLFLVCLLTLPESKRASSSSLFVVVNLVILEAHNPSEFQRGNAMCKQWNCNSIVPSPCFVIMAFIDVFYHCRQKWQLLACS